MSAPLLPLAPGQTPRAWQIEALRAVQVAWRRGLSRVVVSAATGTGKGTLLASLARRAEAKGSRVLILVHRRELIEDLAARVAAIPGPSAPGVVQGRRDGSDAPIVVASVQSLVRRLAGLQPFDLVITDECHHATAPSYQLVYRAVEEARRRAGKPERFAHLGMSATPFRSAADGVSPITGEGEPYEGIVYAHDIVAAIRCGDLVPPRGTAVDTHLDLAGVPMRGADYDEAHLAGVVDVDARNTQIASVVAERAAGRPFLAFAVSVAHAERLAAAMRAAGLRAEAVWGTMPADLRAQRIADYAAGRLDGLVSRDLLFEGFDSPRTALLVAARPTRSQIIAWQLVGRGLRLAPGKVDCEVLDFVGFLRVLDFGAFSGGQGEGEGAAKRKPWTPAPGDRVVLRYAEGRDVEVGVVDEVDDPDAPRFARVVWTAGTQTHAVPDLARAPAEAVEAAPVPIEVRGHTVYSVSLLPGQDVASARGWYSPAKSCSVPSARAESSARAASSARAELSAYGWASQGARLMVAVLVPISAGYSLWAVRLGRDGLRPQELAAEGVHGAIAKKLNEGTDLLALQAEGEAWLDKHGARHLPVNSEPMRAPAPPDLVARLRAARVEVDAAALSRGEGWAVLAHTQARRAVEDARRELRRRFVR